MRRLRQGVRLKFPAKKKTEEDEPVPVQAVDPEEEGYEVGFSGASNAANEIGRDEMKKLKRKLKNDARVRRSSGGSGEEFFSLMVVGANVILGLTVFILCFGGAMMMTDPMKKISSGTTALLGLSWVIRSLVWRFPFSFASGVMRARFNPADGQLYTSAAKDGQFSRIRWTGKRSPVPLGFEVMKTGLRITFSDPLDKKSAEDDDSYSGEWSNPIPLPGQKAEPKSEVTIESAILSKDAKTVTLAIENLRPMSNFTLRYRLKAAAGKTIAGELNGSIHRVS